MTIPRDASEVASSTSAGAALRKDWGEMLSAFVLEWKDVFKSKSLLSDVLAGLTVAAVALPLNLALTVVSGVPPAAGLVAGAVGGFIAAAFGGSSLQVTGPAAALTVMVLAIASKFGIVGVAAAALMVGGMQLLMAFTRAGHLAKFVPESVLAGFTTGVGIKLLDTQVPELLGFDYKVTEMAEMMHRPEWLHEVEWTALVCGLVVAFFIVATRHIKRLPAAIIGIAVVTFVANYVNWDVTRVGEVPSAFPSPALPLLKDDQWLDLFLMTLPLGLLASVESLLSANVVGRMTAATGRRPHHPSLELFGQGLANIAVGLMSGMPVSGVVVRSSTNVQTGAKTRLASMLHAVFLGAAVLFASQYISRVPLAGLAGLLCVIAFRLIEVKTFFELVNHSKIEALAFIVTCLGTVGIPIEIGEVRQHFGLMAGLVSGLLISAVGRFIERQMHPARALQAERKPGIRAVLSKSQAEARHPEHAHAAPSKAQWMPNVRGRAVKPKSVFIHPQATVIGRVVFGENVHIAAGASVRADEGSPFFIGDDSNIQDGVVIHALQQKWVSVGGEEWAVYVGRKVSMAHNALVHGPCFIGDGSFIGFKAVVHDSVVGKGCFVGISAVVVGVEVPDGRFVPNGTIVDSMDKVDALPLVQESQMHFNEDVVEVNRGLSAAYRSTTEVDDKSVPSSRETSKPSVWNQRWARAASAKNSRF